MGVQLCKISLSQLIFIVQGVYKIVLVIIFLLMLLNYNLYFYTNFDSVT